MAVVKLDLSLKLVSIQQCKTIVSKACIKNTFVWAPVNVVLLMKYSN